jgi:hypothetical protein
MHFAVVMGDEDTRLYYNGMELGALGVGGAFQTVGNGDNYFLGRNNWRQSQGGQLTDLNGELDEFRIWDHARTGDQIRANMFTRLSGTEAGLLGLWNFDGDEAEDATANALHGTMAGDATTRLASWPQPEDRPPEAVLSFRMSEPIPAEPLPMIGVLRDRDEVIDARRLRSDATAPVNLLIVATNPPYSLTITHPSRGTRVARPEVAAGQTTELTLRLPEPGANAADIHNAYGLALADFILNDPNALDQLPPFVLAMYPKQLEEAMPAFV